MTICVLNDLHVGVQRSGGTTPMSAWQLRTYVLKQFQELLDKVETDLLILGDLFDTFSIPYWDLLAAFRMLQEWVDRNPSMHLTLVAGNHDQSKTMATMSSFQFLCKVWEGHPRVHNVQAEGQEVPNHPGHWVIPHMVNQDSFDLELTRVPKGTKYLFVHANYHNFHAQQSDHSLNLSEKQAQDCPAEAIIFAHEHQHRRELGGKVFVIGNQIPTSVADCLGNDFKQYLEINDGLVGVVCWKAGGSFYRADWRELADVPATAEFVRVQGDASELEAPAVASAISKFRNKHNAFVVTNAVSIAGRSPTGDAMTLEQIKAFNVFDVLMKKLKPEQQKVVKELWEARDVR